MKYFLPKFKQTDRRGWRSMQRVSRSRGEEADQLLEELHANGQYGLGGSRAYYSSPTTLKILGIRTPFF
jgi:hypothetical protein